ncbi:MAG: hypothetical protein IJE58_03815, partial [Oscillospiraceae bacterium]|nr:hypothetical protein [Oscillospiraceae bacterium]
LVGHAVAQYDDVFHIARSDLFARGEHLCFNIIAFLYTIYNMPNKRNLPRICGLCIENVHNPQ